VLQSHTATQQWQSFEMRMRQRRVERCLLRASVAIEAGVLEDAREAIEEVRRLSPDEPGLQSIAAQFAAAERLPPAAQFSDLILQQPAAEHAAGEAAPQTTKHRVPAVAAAILLLVASAAGGWWWTSGVEPAAQSVNAPTAPSDAAAAPAAVPPSRAVHVSETAVNAPVREEPLPPAPTTDSVPFGPTATLGTTRANPNPEVHPPATVPQPDARPARDEYATKPATAAAGRAPAPSPVRPGEAAEPRAPFVDARNSAPVRLPGAEVTPSAPSAPAPSVRVESPANLPVDAAPRVVSGVDAVGEPAATPRAIAPPPAPASPPPASPAPVSGTDEQSVRAVLTRYEAAYTRLDAAAAASVYPGVNQRALATAFDGLSAQAISLGRCDVRVSGATARAECSGTARWTPKVGGGAQGAPRQWRFDLRNANGNWVITQATTR
jgi:hypothetical protein